MKKYLALILALVMSLSLVACGGGEAEGEGEGDAIPNVPNTADPFSLGMYATMAVASLGGLVALKKKSRG